MVVTQVYVVVKSHRPVYLKYVHLLYANYTLIKFIKWKILQKRKTRTGSHRMEMSGQPGQEATQRGAAKGTGWCTWRQQSANMQPKEILGPLPVRSSSPRILFFRVLIWLFMLQGSNGMPFLWGLSKGVSPPPQNKCFLSHNLVSFFPGNSAHLKSTSVMYLFNGLLSASFH